MSGCLFVLGLLFFFIGLVIFFSPTREEVAGRMLNTIAQARSTGLNRVLTGAPTGPAAPTPAVFGKAASENQSAEGAMSYTPMLNQIRVGQRIRVRHPVQGELTVYVLCKVVYEELWQTQRGPQVPWTPTGSTFSGFWLETNLFLLNWQNRYYMLDEATYLSDAEIQRDFAPHARKFAQSNQTEDVYFAYPPASWHIDDIGKFRIRSVEGEGLPNVPGSIGRFVHCSGDSGRALVLEDYETGGGQDVVWTGYHIEAEDIIA